MFAVGTLRRTDRHIHFLERRLIFKAIHQRLQVYSDRTVGHPLARQGTIAATAMIQMYPFSTGGLALGSGLVIHFSFRVYHKLLSLAVRKAKFILHFHRNSRPPSLTTVKRELKLFAVCK